MKFAVLDANAYWTEHLFSECSRLGEVLLLKPREFRAHRAQWKTILSDSAPRQVRDGVFEQRLSFPPGWMVELWPLSRRRIAQALRKFAGCEPLTLIITYPQYRSLLSRLKPALSIYYNLDDYRDNWPRHRKRLPDWEVQTVEAADLTICIAAHRVKVLCAMHPLRRDRIHHLPLGCTPQFMASPTLDATEGLPPALASLKRPLAGYVGALNHRFDFALVARLAECLPDVTFVLGGRVEEDGDAAWRAGFVKARATSNIHFLGWVDHNDLGTCLRACDVLLMPYTHCNFNTNACPSKLWDYLGTGRPIVANQANPETLLWREIVRIADTPEAFARQVREALSETDTKYRDRRISIAREHTWQKRGEQLVQLLSRNLNGRDHRRSTVQEHR